MFKTHFPMFKPQFNLRFAIALLIWSGGTLAQAPNPENQAPNAESQQPAFSGQTRAPESAVEQAFELVTIAGGLEFPWAVEFLPDGSFLVTERPGRLRVIAADGSMSDPLQGLPAIDYSRQGGLMDVALDPDFASNQTIFFSFSESADGNANHTALARARLVLGSQPRLEDTQVIYRQQPSTPSPFHFGSRIVFAADKTLLMIQGERGADQYRPQAQALDSLLGKLVRLNRDGSIPTDNPFAGQAGARGEIWSYGHRNSSALAFRPGTDELWEVEHGTRGGDEINIIERGGNYGWPDAAYGIEYMGQPIAEGATTAPGTIQPVYYWDPVIAPGGMAFYNGDLFPDWKGSLFVTGLNSRYVARLTLDGQRIVGEERLLEDVDTRWRDIAQGPDGAIYLTTDPCGNGGRCSEAERSAGRLIKLVPAP